MTTKAKQAAATCAFCGIDCGFISLTDNVCLTCGDRWQSLDKVDLIARLGTAAAKLSAMGAALDAISMLGGNLPDDRLTDKTGPNDAAARGLMYVEARRQAREALALATGETP